jgi:hypothetical protein
MWHSVAGRQGGLRRQAGSGRSNAGVAAAATAGLKPPAGARPEVQLQHVDAPRAHRQHETGGEAVHGGGDGRNLWGRVAGRPEQDKMAAKSSEDVVGGARAPPLLSAFNSWWPAAARQQLEPHQLTHQ